MRKCTSGLMRPFVAGLFLSVAVAWPFYLPAQTFDISPPSRWQVGEDPAPPEPPPIDPPQDPELIAIPEFQSVAIEFDANDDFTPTLEYREDGSSTWLPGHELMYDPHDTQWRGVVVGLDEGTGYELQVTYNAVEFFRAFDTWPAVSTWTVGSTTNISTSQTITTGGSATGANAGDMANHTWKVYDGQGNTINGGTICVHIDASYVILRNVKCTNQDGNSGGPIRIEAGQHHVVIEDNEISGWDDGGNFNSNLEGNAISFQSNPDTNSGTTDQHHVVIQRNHVHDSAQLFTKIDRNGSVGQRCVTWRQYEGVGSNVVRYNTCIGDETHAFGDAMGGGINFTSKGFPGANAAFYGNYASWCVDDCYEMETGGRNLRFWGNFADNYGVAFAFASITEGPAFIFRNVVGACWGVDAGGNCGHLKTKKATGQACSDCNYTATEHGNHWHGRLYIYHNSLHYIVGTDSKHPTASNHYGGDAVAQTWKNNISVTSSADGLEDRKYPEGEPGAVCNTGDIATQITYSYSRKGIVSECPDGAPDDTEGNIETLDFPDWANYTYPLSPGQTGLFQLNDGAPGHDDGTVIPNFSDGYLGAAPDMGAEERGASGMCFGHSC